MDNSSYTCDCNRNLTKLCIRRGRRRLRWWNCAKLTLLIGHLNQKAVVWIIQCLLFITMLNTVACNLCDLDTGYTTITDGRGYPHSVYISVTRDGSIWVRSGQDYKNNDWVYYNEHSRKLQVTILSSEIISMLKSFNYTDYCVQTDLELKVKMDAGWHPTYIKTYKPASRSSPVLAFRNQMDCYMNTTLSLSANKQGLVCHGGPRHACGSRQLPSKGQMSATAFLRFLMFNPEGPEHYRCQQPPSLTSYSFIGSYYHAYVKLASCPQATDSRMFGHEAKLRPSSDDDFNVVMIPDPTQTALASGIIIGWQVYAKVVSWQHQVYLQVWRKSGNPFVSDQYNLIAQTFFNPEQLRFKEIPLKPDNYIQMKKGDLLGLYYSMQNPLPYSTVPCSSTGHIMLHIKRTPRELVVGQTYEFVQKPVGPSSCRQYSFTAVLANKSDSKLIEDWLCPGKEDKNAGSRLLGPINQGSDSTKKPVVNEKDSPPKDPSDMVLPIHYILAIIGGLLLLMTIIGGISYYRAIKG